MSKIIDITDKLNFEEKPIIRVKNVELQANNDAVSMLKVTALFSEEDITIQNILDVYNLIFDEENRKKIESLNLSMRDFQTLIMETSSILINDGEDNTGETQTPATT